MEMDWPHTDKTEPINHRAGSNMDPPRQENKRKTFHHMGRSTEQEMKMKKKRAWQQLDGKGQYQRGFSEGLCFSGSFKARVRPDSLIMQSL